ncbi:MAG: hypothetical protein ACOYM3_09245 [Terrimicrobiaceae bacterium]
MKSLVYPVLAILFVGLLALGIYRKTSRAVAPPLYDALTYYEKAFSVWNGLLSEDKILNPFHAPPVIRPPGSVPVTAPFGISNSRQGYQWFYFRNLFVPIALWMGACFIAFPVRSKDPADKALKYALVAALGMLPMFFNMEYNEAIGIGYWGLQDTLVAALAGLALALTLRGHDGRSVFRTVAGSVIAAYTIWIKPSGALVILIVLAFWSAELIFRLWYFRTHPRLKRLTLSYALKSLPFVLLIPGIFAGIAFSSPYLSSANLAWAKEAQTIVLGMYSTFSIVPLLLLANRSIGYIWLALFLVIGFCAILVAIGKRKPVLSIPATRIFLSGGALLCSFYWWYTMAGPLDRYMFPFLLMTIIGVGNPVWNLFAGCNRSACKNALALFFGALALFPLIVLLHGSPSNRLQVFLGINLASGGFKDAMAAAKYIRTESKALDGEVRVFAPDPGGAAMGTAFIESSLELANHSGQRFIVIHPFPWAKNSMLAVEPFCSADYILLNDAEKIPALPEGGFARDFQQEMVVLKHFLKDLQEADGIRKIHFSGICVIEVRDRIKLREAFFRMVDSHKWREEFHAENNRSRELEAAFDRSRDTAYRTSSESPDRNLSPSSRVKLLSGVLPGEFVVEAEAPPSIMIPPFSNNQKHKAYLKMELGVPSPRTQQVFYRENTASESKEGVAVAECGRGDNILFFEIPLTGESTSLRIATGTGTGRQSLKSIEIRRAD